MPTIGLLVNLWFVLHGFVLYDTILATQATLLNKTKKGQMPLFILLQKTIM